MLAWTYHAGTCQLKLVIPPIQTTIQNTNLWVLCLASGTSQIIRATSISSFKLHFLLTVTKVQTETYGERQVNLVSGISLEQSPEQFQTMPYGA